MIEYQIGESIKMPQEQFECSQYAKNEWIVSDVNDEVVFIVQHSYDEKGIWTGAIHTGIYKKMLDYSNR